MNFKKLSVTCLSMLFSIVPVCSYAMKEDISKNLSVNSNKVLNEECPICQNELKCNDVIITPCDHKFCASCLYKSVYLSKDYFTNKFVVKNLCPCCRSKLNAKFRYDLRKAVEKINQTATDNEKINIDDRTVDVHDLPGMQGKTDREIIRALANMYSDKSVFIYCGDAQDGEILTAYFKKITGKNYIIPCGLLCVYEFNVENPLCFTLNISEMLIETNEGTKFIVIKDSNLGKEFEETLKQMQRNIV